MTCIYSTKGIEGKSGNPGERGPQGPVVSITRALSDFSLAKY